MAWQGETDRMRQLVFLAVALFGWGSHAFAAPRVAADIAPVHSLVASVMEGVGEPALIVPRGASPHGHSLRPSEASALAGADLVVWMGPALTPWLEQAVERLGGDARSLVLLDVDGTTLLPYRDDPNFEPEDAADEHGETDPHAWLDPENAILWLHTLADALARIDPENADLYRANAETAGERIAGLAAEIADELAPVKGHPFIVFHDAYQYFEHRFGLRALGAIAHGDAAPPGPRRIAAMRKLIRDKHAACIFAEPQFPSALIATVTEGTETRAAVLDPLGVDLEPGSDLYGQLIRDIADQLQACLGG